MANQNNKFISAIISLVMLSGCMTKVAIDNNSIIYPVEEYKSTQLNSAGLIEGTETGIVGGVSETKPYNSSKVSTPEEGKSTIVGRLMSIGSEKPVALSKIYLGRKMYLTPGPDYLIGLETNSALFALTDENGDFVFNNIDAANYILLLVTPMSTYPIYFEDNKEVIVDTKVNEILDLEIIFTTWQ